MASVVATIRRSFGCAAAHARPNRGLSRTAITNANSAGSSFSPQEEILCGAYSKMLHPSNMGMKGIMD